jgi:iron complex outermembrane receptor protein
MAYQGIAGTTDISTVHPLAYNGRQTAATYRHEYNEQDANIPGLDRTGDRANLTYIDQFRDGTVGLALGAAYNKSPYQAQTREPWGYPDVGGNLVIGGDKDGVQSSFYERKAYLGVFEFQPNDRLHMLVDGYHSDFEELQTVQRVEFGTIWAGATLSNPGPVVNGRIQSGTFANVPFVVIENYNNDRNADVDSIGWNTQFDLNDDWSFNGDLSWSRVKREDLRLESTAAPARTTIHRSCRTSTPFPSRPMRRHLAFHADARLQRLQHGVPDRSGRLGRRRAPLGLRRQPHDRGRDQGGTVVRRAQARPQLHGQGELRCELRRAREIEGQLPEHPVPAREHFARCRARRVPYRDHQFVVLRQSARGHRLQRPRAVSLRASGSPVDAFLDPNPAVGTGDRQSAVTNDWEVTEKLTTAFVQVGIDTAIGSLPLRGNVGVQSVTADQSSDISFFSAPLPGETFGTVSIVTSGAKYTDVLPSLNLALELPHDMKLRFGAAITVARPRMDDLAGGAGYTVVPDGGAADNVNGQPIYWKRTGGGNPQLKPWKANTFDLSLEKYFAEQAYVSLAVYYKDLKTYIFNSSIIESFEGVLLPGQDSPDDPNTGYTQADANRLGVTTTKVNGSGGYIQGAELTFSMPLSIFAPALDGFGFIVSGAVNDSSIDINGVETPVPGLSDEVINTTLYFEKAGFSARVSNRYRGDFIGEVPEFDSSLTLKNVSAESLLDAQVGYEFQEGFMRGLSVSLSGTNLTDEPFTLNNVDTTSYNLIKHQEYGAVYSVAVTYKF